MSEQLDLFAKLATEATNGNPIQSEDVPDGNSEKTQVSTTPGDTNSESLGVGMARESQEADRDGRVPGGPDDSGEERTPGVERVNSNPPGETRDRTGIRSELGAADLVNHLIDDVDKIDIRPSAPGRKSLPNNCKTHRKPRNWESVEMNKQNTFAKLDVTTTIRSVKQWQSQSQTSHP